MLRTDEQVIFDGFGPTWLAAGGPPSTTIVDLPEDRAAAREMLRSNCPLAPGVYGMIDRDGLLIYVGKSKSLRDRLLSYLAGKSADPKARRIVAHTERLIWESSPHEFAALVRELELIRRWCPKYNVRGRPGRVRRAYVGLGRGEAPGAYIAEKAARGEDFLIGPFPPGRDLQRMVRSLNDCFQLRACPERTPMFFADQRELFAENRAPRCLRSELGTCLGPCAAACTGRQYGANVRAAKAFLRGADTATLGRLEEAMLAAAAEEQFERAAVLRDAWKDLGQLRDLTDRITKVRRDYSFVYPLPSYEGGESWYMVHHGQLLAVVPSPSNRRAAKQALRVLDKTYPGTAAELWLPPADDPDLILLVSLWFRAKPDEMARTMSVETAFELCLSRAGTPRPLHRQGTGRQ